MLLHNIGGLDGSQKWKLGTDKGLWADKNLCRFWSVTKITPRRGAQIVRSRDGWRREDAQEADLADGMDLDRRDLRRLDAVAGVVLVHAQDGVANLDVLDVLGDGIGLLIVPRLLV